MAWRMVATSVDMSDSYSVEQTVGWMVVSWAGSLDLLWVVLKVGQSAVT